MAKMKKIKLEENKTTDKKKTYVVRIRHANKSEGESIDNNTGCKSEKPSLKYLSKKEIKDDFLSLFKEIYMKNYEPIDIALLLRKINRSSIFISERSSRYFNYLIDNYQYSNHFKLQSFELYKYLEHCDHEYKYAIQIWLIYKLIVLSDKVDITDVGDNHLDFTNLNFKTDMTEAEILFCKLLDRLSKEDKEYNELCKYLYKKRILLDKIESGTFSYFDDM